MGLRTERRIVLPAVPKKGPRPTDLELLRDKTHMLSGKDRVLMKMYLERGSSPTELARLAGVTEQRITRRLSKIAARLIEGRYVNCLQRRDKLTELELGAARDRFIDGLSVREMAAKWGWSYHHARNTLRKIRRVLGESL